MTDKDLAHKKKMQKQKEKVDASIAAATEEKGVMIVLTGNGKGKSSSGFGMLFRALGYGQKVAAVQFIKGAQTSGEALLIKNQFPDMPFVQMATGFTWNTQDRQADIEASEKTWAEAEKLLKDETIDVLLLDELTYMIAYKYLDERKILDALANRPKEQSVIVTGRGGGKGLQELADTVAEVKDVKHAYRAGIKARQGVDY